MQHWNKEQASEFHWTNFNNGDLVIWSVTYNSSDFPGKYVARPVVVPALHPDPFGGGLIADSLDELRSMLPDSLIRMDRQPTDDPVIVEVWF